MPKQKQNNMLRKALHKARMFNKRENLSEKDEQVQREKNQLYMKKQRSRLSKDQEEEERIE